MAKPTKKWPRYNAGPSEHLHAIGVLVTNHAEFESKLFQLFSHHLERIQMPKSLIKLFYSEWTTPQRLEATSKVFAAYDAEQGTIECVKRLRKYFNKCAEIRNQIGHSFHLPPLFSRKDDIFYFVKLSKRNLEQVRSPASLKKLRYLADAIKVGTQKTDQLIAYLHLRDTPPEKRRTLWALNALLGLNRDEPPSIPRPPRGLKSPRPTILDMPPHLRRS